MMLYRYRKRPRSRPLWAIQSMRLLLLVCCWSFNCSSIDNVAAMAQTVEEKDTTNNSTTLLPGNNTSNTTGVPTQSNAPSQSLRPSASPTASPVPSIAPSTVPSASPTISSAPTTSHMPSTSSPPSHSPTTSHMPSTSPLPSNSIQPSISPSTSFPSDAPSLTPTMVPTMTVSPSSSPSITPTNYPTVSMQPSDQPTLSLAPSVSDQPSSLPSMIPTEFPSNEPSTTPTTLEPSSNPSTGFPSTVPSSSPTIVRRIAFESSIYMTFEGFSNLWDEQNQTIWEQITTQHVSSYYSKLVEELTDIAPVEVSSVTTTFINQMFIPATSIHHDYTTNQIVTTNVVDNDSGDDGDGSDGGGVRKLQQLERRRLSETTTTTTNTTWLEVEYNQTIVYGLRIIDPEFDEQQLFVIPFQWDVTQYLVNLVIALDTDTFIRLVNIHVGNTTLPPILTSPTSAPTSSSESESDSLPTGARIAIILVVVIAVLFILSALIWSLYKREEQHQQTRLFGDPRTPEERASFYQERLRQQQDPHYAMETSAAGSGEGQDPLAEDRVSQLSSSVQSNPDQGGGGSGTGVGSGRQHLPPQSMLSNHPTTTTPERGIIPNESSMRDVVAYSQKFSNAAYQRYPGAPLSNIQRSSSRGAEPSDLTPGATTGASDRISEITNSEHGGEGDTPALSQQLSQEMRGSNQSFPLSPVHIPDEEEEEARRSFEDLSEDNDDDDDFDHSEDHQDVLGLGDDEDDHPLRPAPSSFDIQIQELE